MTRSPFVYPPGILVHVVMTETDSWKTMLPTALQGRVSLCHGTEYMSLEFHLAGCKSGRILRPRLKSHEVCQGGEP